MRGTAPRANTRCDVANHSPLSLHFNQIAIAASTKNWGFQRKWRCTLTESKEKQTSQQSIMRWNSGVITKPQIRFLAQSRHYGKEDYGFMF